MEVFRTGNSQLEGEVDADSGELQGVREGLGIRSAINVPLYINNELRGVLSAVSIRRDAFTEQDLEFTRAVAGWIGVIADGSELSEAMAEQAFRRGRRDASQELSGLTARQREIAECIAKGLTNEEIAVRLVLTPGTVANHVASILNGLDLRNRTQIATWAVDRGLYEPEVQDKAVAKAAVDGNPNRH